MPEGRKFLIAIFVSICVHALLLGLLCLLGLLIPREVAASLTPTPSADPLKLTIIRKSSTPAPTPPQLVAVQTVPVATPTPSPTPEVKRKLSMLSSQGLTGDASPPPKDARFESDVNSHFASEKEGPRTGDMPSQEGHKLNFTELENRTAVVAPSPAPVPVQQPPVGVSAVTPNTRTNFYQPTPVPKKPKTKPRESSANIAMSIAKNISPTPTPKPSATPTPSATPQDETNAVSEVAPPRPRLRVPTLPGYQPQNVKTQIAGSGGPKGKASVDAMSTPLGRYRKLISDAVGSRWYYYVQQRSDLMMAGEVVVAFYVTAEGKIQDARIVSNSATESLGAICIKAVMESEAPPIPKDLVETLPNRRMPIDFTFNLYSLQ